MRCTCGQVELDMPATLAEDLTVHFTSEPCQTFRHDGWSVDEEFSKSICVNLKSSLHCVPIEALAVWLKSNGGVDKLRLGDEEIVIAAVKHCAQLHRRWQVAQNGLLELAAENSRLRSQLEKLVNKVK